MTRIDLAFATAALTRDESDCTADIIAIIDTLEMAIACVRSDWSCGRCADVADQLARAHAA